MNSFWLIFLIGWYGIWSVFTFITGNLIYGGILGIMAIISLIIFKKMEKK